LRQEKNKLTISSPNFGLREGRRIIQISNFGTLAEASGKLWEGFTLSKKIFGKGLEQKRGKCSTKNQKKEREVLPLYFCTKLGNFNQQIIFKPQRHFMVETKIILLPVI